MVSNLAAGACEQSSSCHSISSYCSILYRKCPGQAANFAMRFAGKCIRHRHLAALPYGSDFAFQSPEGPGAASEDLIGPQ